MQTIETHRPELERRIAATRKAEELADELGAQWEFDDEGNGRYRFTLRDFCLSAPPPSFVLIFDNAKNRFSIYCRRVSDCHRHEYGEYGSATVSAERPAAAILADFWRRVVKRYLDEYAEKLTEADEYNERIEQRGELLQRLADAIGYSLSESELATGEFIAYQHGLRKIRVDTRSGVYIETEQGISGESALTVLESLKTNEPRSRH